MFETIRNKAIKATPESMRGPLLDGVEKSALGESNEIEKIFYQKHARGVSSNGLQGRLPASMGIAERTWFLLDSTQEQRQEYIEFIDPLDSVQYEQIAAAFGYKDKEKPILPADPQQTRDLLFAEFLQTLEKGDKSNTNLLVSRVKTVTQGLGQDDVDNRTGV